MPTVMFDVFNVTPAFILESERLHLLRCMTFYNLYISFVDTFKLFVFFFREAKLITG